MRDIDCLQTECQLLKQENRLLKEAVGRQVFTKSWFESDDSKVKFYTGLPSFQILMTLFDFITMSVACSDRSSLPLLQQFIMTLMKLRLNIENQHLAYLFGVHHSTVSQNFRKWIYVMYERPKPLVIWPEREQLPRLCQCCSGRSSNDVCLAWIVLKYY